MRYIAAANRYEQTNYRTCGNSGIKLPEISLGLWHNFGSVDAFENSRMMALRAFDLGINHFDLANNYGPIPGSAEITFGKILKEDLAAYRDELFISTKAGWPMWPGPYGDLGSKKHLIASLDQSLKRMGLEYVDVYYHHRPDPETPLSETLAALDFIVKSGKALYVGLSSYNAEQTEQAIKLFNKWNTPFLLHQPRYSLFERGIEAKLLPLLKQKNVGCATFSPLAQGLLSDKYLKEIPVDSRAAKESGYLKVEAITERKVNVLKELNTIALNRGQSLAQMAVAWVLRSPVITSTIIGASKVSQIEEIQKGLSNKSLNAEELNQIELALSHL